MAVLIAYGSSGGSTRGIANRVAARLRQQGVVAEARPVTGPVDVASYDAVVLGSAVHGAKWLPGAARFANTYAELLRVRPVWLFSVSTVGDEESMFPPRVAKKLRGMRRETEEISGLRAMLRAREHRNFAGAITRSDWPLTGRVFFRVIGGRYGDHRNWPAVDAWADRIAATLSTERTSAEPRSAGH